MDTCGRIAGQMALTREQEARFEALTAKALPASVPVEPVGHSDAEPSADADPAPTRNSDPDSAT